jgi:hypothetical protein
MWVARCVLSNRYIRCGSSFQDTKLPPRAAFTAQIVGTLFGAVLNFSASHVRLCQKNTNIVGLQS